MIKNLKLSELELNSGQLEGLPKNPRFIRDERFEKLKKSIEEAPEMLALRELLIYPLDNGKFIVIGGNMRLRACKDLGYKELPCKIIAKETSIEKLREYTIKDNVAFGQEDWGILKTEWESDEVIGWGVETYKWGEDSTQTDFQSYQNGESQFQQPTTQFNLPTELQGEDINPDELPRIVGDDTVAKERIIIVYDKDKEQQLTDLLGLESIVKVVYSLEELIQ